MSDFDQNGMFYWIGSNARYSHVSLSGLFLETGREEGRDSREREFFIEIKGTNWIKN